MDQHCFHHKIIPKKIRISVETKSNNSECMAKFFTKINQMIFILDCKGNNGKFLRSCRREIRGKMKTKDDEKSALKWH